MKPGSVLQNTVPEQTYASSKFVVHLNSVICSLVSIPEYQTQLSALAKLSTSINPTTNNDIDGDNLNDSIKNNLLSQVDYYCEKKDKN